MPSDLKAMIKKVSIYDGIIFIISGIISYKFFTNCYVYILIGILVAQISFISNSIITNYVVNNKSTKVIIPISTLFRILIICIIGAMIIKYNTNNIFPFIIGYSLHFMGIIFYSLNINK